MYDSLDLKALRQEAAAHRKSTAGGKTTARGWLRTLVWVIVGIGAGVLMAMGKLGRGYDAYINLAAVVIAGSLVWSLIKALRDQRRNAPRIEQYAPAFVRRANWLDTLWTILFYVAAFAWMGFARLTTTNSLTFIGVFLSPLLVYTLFGVVYGWVRNAGLGAVNIMAQLVPYHAVKNLKGMMLLQAGQFNEAEEVYRQMLERGHPNTQYIAVWLNNMGYALTLVKRYGEALPILEAAIRIAPEIGNSYDSLATWYLEQKLDPKRALELTQIALESTVGDQAGGRAIQQATCARAYALIGEKAQAEALINTALTQVDSLPSLYTGEIHRQIGFARLALGEADAARHHFSRATELDPDGLFGKLAQQALRTEMASA